MYRKRKGIVSGPLIPGAGRPVVWYNWRRNRDRQLAYVEDQMRENHMKKNLFVLLAVSVLAAGCMSAPQHASDVRRGMDGDRLTVGTVQREIRVGMTGADVAGVLGSPNIVTKDDLGEVWVYDRISTDTVYSTSSGGVSALILGAGVTGTTGLAGGGSTGYNRGAGAVSTRQRSLTIIIKYDNQGRVRDFAYHASSF